LISLTQKINSKLSSQSAMLTNRK